MIDVNVICSNIRRLGKRLRRFDFSVFEIEAKGYFATTICERNRYEGTATISDQSDEFESTHAQSFVEVNKYGNLRVVTKRNFEDHSFYNKEVKSVLEYLSEPRWIVALNKHEKV